MTSNVKMILDEVNARIKLAEAKTAEDPSNFDSFPGAENDKPVSAETKKPDPEVKEEGPASRTEVTGAEPGSDAPVQQDHLYEADEPVLTPEKKPAESDDANAKEASANPDVTKVATDILSIIKGAMAKKAAAKPAEAKKAGKPEEKTAEAKKADKPEEKTAAAPVSKTTKPEKKAENNMISLEQKILDKIASVRMAKQAGANDAAALIKAANDYNRGAQDAVALLTKLAQDAGMQTPEEAGAADAEAGIADAAAAAGDAGAADEQVTPEEVAQAVGELVQEGQISEEDAAELIGQIDGGEGGGEGDVSEDEIAEGIAQAIESGELSEDEAQQLVQELVDAGADESVADQVAADGDAGAAAEDAGAAAEEAGAADAEAALADAAAADEAQKTAEAKTQVERYQKGFIQKCAEYGVDPQRLAQYIQARTGTAR